MFGEYDAMAAWLKGLVLSPLVMREGSLHEGIAGSLSVVLRRARNQEFEERPLVVLVPEIIGEMTEKKSACFITDISERADDVSRKRFSAP